ncbi:Semenogelin I [Macaca mulatta]|uniref:Semenogelin I n=1 Tax=Macaca mulatta TaxID=9544 RepID=G7N4R1_MACMU|nr:Semenogelin I [Macaca mulatta]
MKPNIIFVLSLLLILERQAAVMGQKGGSKGQLPSGSSQFPQRQKGQHYSGQKDKQHTESKGSFSIQHTYHVDANDRDRTRKSQQYYSNAQHKTTKSEQHLRGSQELLNYKLEGRDSAKSKGHFHVIVIHHKGGQDHHGTQNPSQDQGNSPSGKGISSQYSNTEERLRVRGLSKEQASASGAQKGRTQGGSQTNYVLQTEELVAKKQQRETQNSHRQEQEHSQKANKISYQSSSTEERRLRYGENGVQKDVSQSSIYRQTEEKAHGKSQKQITIPSQEQEYSQKANKISYQSSSTEERRLHYGENDVQKDVSQSSIYRQTEEKAHGKSQKQVTIPSQEQEHSQKANQISYQSSSTEERRLHYGEKGVQKVVSQSSIYSQTENLIAGKSQIQAPNPKQQSRHGENANGESGQSTNREQDLLSHEQKVRHQHGSHGALDVVIVEHEGDGNHHLVQRRNYNRNPLST